MISLNTIKGTFKYELHIRLGCLLLIMTIISGIANRAAGWEMLAFWLFQIGMILLPGMAILSILKVKQITQMENLLFSYASGYVVSILVYYVLMFGKIEGNAGRWLCIGLSIVSLYVIHKGNETKYEGEITKGRKYVWIILLSIIFIIYFFAFSMKHVIPDYLKYNSWHGDLLYWIGDIVALEKGYPPLNFRTLSENYSYHYLGALQLALVSKVTGVSAAEVALNYSYIQAVVMLGLSTLCLTERIIVRKEVGLFTLFLLLFSTGWEKSTGVTFFWHIYQVPMSFNIAYSLEIIIVLLVLIQMVKEKVDYANLFLLGIFLLVCTGTKGPSGAVVLCGIGIVCLCWILRKEYKKSLMYGIIALTAFCIVYFGLLASGNSNYLRGAVYDDPYKISIYNNLIVNLKILFWKTLKYFLNLFLINPWTVVPGGIYILYVIFKKCIKSDDMMFLFMGIIGTVLGYILHYYGNSEIYFSLSVLPFIAILAGKGIDVAVGAVLFSKSKRMFVESIVTVSAVGGILTVAWMGNWKNSLQDYVICGIQHLIGRETEYVSNTQMMTGIEYEAYKWIEENTEDTSVLLSDRMLEEESFCYIPGVFAERYVYYYADKTEIEKAISCFGGNSEEIGFFADKGIDYIVQNKRISSEKKLFSDKYTEVVYENTEVIVYRLREE